jgi:hypothetical protein
MTLDLPESLPCPRCGKDSEHVILVAPAVSTANMTHMTQDMAIGKDANQRWDRIHEKRAAKDKIRRESGKTGLMWSDAEKTFKPTDRKLEFVTTPKSVPDPSKG